MGGYSLDSNTLSRLLRRDVKVLARFSDAASRAEIVLCPVAYFEVRRDLEWKSAPRQLRELDELAQECVWLEFTREIWLSAARMWSDAQRAGHPIKDADLLIGAHARFLGAVVVTSDADFKHLPVETEDWLGT